MDNITIANFTKYETVNVSGLWQYNYGQILRIQGLKLPTAVEIHFALQEKGGDSVTRVGMTKDGVTDVVIPDSMLENNDTNQDYNIYAFVYLTDETSGQTEYKIKMFVQSRPRPEAFNRPEDAELFREAIQAVNDSAERAENAAEESEKNAQQTADDRETVKEMVTMVSDIKEQVQEVKEYKEQAQTAATNALQSESESAKAKEEAVKAQAGSESAADAAEQHALETAGDKAEVERLAGQVRQDKTSVEQIKAEVDNTVQGFTITSQQALADVSNAGQTQTERVQEAGKSTVGEIQSAKTSAVGDVETAKSEAVKEVQSEGNKQVKAVQDEGERVLESIPADFLTQMESKLDKNQGAENAGKALVIGEAGNVIPGEVKSGDGIAIVNTMSGESPLVISDSAERPIKDIEIFGNIEQDSTTGAQLLEEKLSAFNTIKHHTEEEMVAYIELPEGHETKSYTMFIKLKPGKTDTIGFTAGFYDKSNMSEPYKVVCLKDGKLVNSNGLINSIVSVNHYVCFKPAMEEFFDIYNIIYAEGKLTSLPYEPYTGGQPSPSPEYPQEIRSVGKYNEETGKYEVDIKVTGKNMIGDNVIFDNTGINTTDGSLIKAVNICITDIIKLKKGVNYIISLNNIDNISFNGFFYDENKKFIGYVFGSMSNTRLIIPEYNAYMRILFNKPKAQVLSKNIQLELGKTETPYEPYKEQTLTLTSDRQLTKWDKLVEQDGQIGWLYGSKKATFENAVIKNVLETNSTKQFSISYEDVKDSYSTSVALCNLFAPATGYELYTQSGKSDFYMGLWNKSVMFSSKKLDGIFQTKESFQEWLRQSELYIWHKTDNEEFIPLPQSEQDAIRALSTYYPTTVISAGDGEMYGDVELTYIADTKNYIDNQIKAVTEKRIETNKLILERMI